MADLPIQLGNVGTSFEATIVDQDGNVRDVSTATTKELIFQPPNGDARVKAASFTNDGVDGKIRWTTQTAADLDQDGTWAWQGHVVLSGGQDFRTEKKYFPVERNLA